MILSAFGRWQRPIAWGVFVLSMLALGLILSTIWAVSDPVGTSLTILVLVQGAFASLQEVENEVDDGGQAEE